MTPTTRVAFTTSLALSFALGSFTADGQRFGPDVEYADAQTTAIAYVFLPHPRRAKA